MGITKSILQNEKPKLYLDFLFRYFKGVRINKPPIFIVGCGHSGTSLLLKILDMHPDINGIPYESRVFLKSNLKILLARAIWYKNTIAAGKHRWAEKTPKHIFALNRILRIYPNAKILLIVRDGRDVAVSIRKRTGDFSSGVERWINDNRAAESFWDNPQVYKLTYENLVSKFEATMKGVCEFLNEPYDPSIINFHEKSLDLFGLKSAPIDPETTLSGEGKDHNKFRNWQIHQPLFNATGKWRQEMSDDEKAIFKQNAGQMLIDYDYATDMNW